MKKISLIILLLILIVIVISMFKNKINKDLNQTVYSPTKAISPTSPPVTPKGKTSLSLFVPYWGLTDDKIESGKYDQIIYFGISPNPNKNESQLNNFNNIVPPNSKKILAIQMTNNDENLAILKDPSKQQKLIQQSIEITQKNNMQGIVLDLEISAIPFDSLVKQISSFTKTFYTTVKKNNLTFSLTLYGDTLYRPRPYDSKTLAQNADSIMIMAYDFSKAKGNPGPNFPINGNERFGYDLSEMSDDFLKVSPPEKISVIFGLFGYDWVVDEKGNALEQAQPLTLLQIKQKFINQCAFPECEWKRDKESAETTVSYTDNEGKKHIVWFEDMESIKQKQELLKKKGINSFGYWAYSYF